MLGGLQRLRRWLLCLFLVAQTGGVMPSVYVDTVHEFAHADAIVVSAVTAGGREHRDQHHPGIHDEHDQCCTLHHGLIGMATQAIYQMPLPVISVVSAHTPTAPPNEHPRRIDRPPRA